MRAVRNAVGTCSLGSAVSEEVSELLWMHSTPISRITSCTAKAPLDASPSMMSWQPSLLMRSRVTLAASCGAPLESRTTSSILRPLMPPASLNLSKVILRPPTVVWPRTATLPDRMVGTPTLMVPLWPLTMAGMATTPASARRALEQMATARRPRNDRLHGVTLPLVFAD